MCKKNKKVKERWLPMILIYKDGSLTRARGQGDITGVDASKVLCFSLDEDGCPHANLDVLHEMKKYPLNPHLGEIVDYWIRHFELMQKRDEESFLQELEEMDDEDDDEDIEEDDEELEGEEIINRIIVLLRSIT